MGANMILGQRYWTTNGHGDEDFFFGCFIDYCILIVGFCISLFLYLFFIFISPFHSFFPLFLCYVCGELCESHMLPFAISVA